MSPQNIVNSPSHGAAENTWIVVASLIDVPKCIWRSFEFTVMRDEVEGRTNCLSQFELQRMLISKSLEQNFFLPHLDLPKLRHLLNTSALCRVLLHCLLKPLKTLLFFIGSVPGDKLGTIWLLFWHLHVMVGAVKHSSGALVFIYVQDQSLLDYIIGA
jgi:hypothetical protein